MASGSGGKFYNSTTAASVDVVLLTNAGFATKITNITGASPLYVTVSHPGGACPVPSVGQSNVVVVPAVANANVSVRHAAQFGTIVQLISAAPTQYLCETQGNHSTS